MPFQLVIPHTSGTSLQITLDAGQILFVLGANGTGKSSLMQRLNRDHSANSRWISAHRQSWFPSNSLTLSPQQKRDTVNNIHNGDFDPAARWKDDYASQRASIAIYDLIDGQNVRARAIADAVDGNDSERVESLKKTDAPIKVINELLKLSNLPIELSIHADDQILASKSNSPPFSIAQLSDGERNALRGGPRKSGQWLSYEMAVGARVKAQHKTTENENQTQAA